MAIGSNGRLPRKLATPISHRKNVPEPALLENCTAHGQQEIYEKTDKSKQGLEDDSDKEHNSAQEDSGYCEGSPVSYNPKRNQNESHPQMDTSNNDRNVHKDIFKARDIRDIHSVGDLRDTRNDNNVSSLFDIPCIQPPAKAQRRASQTYPVDQEKNLVSEPIRSEPLVMQHGKPTPVDRTQLEYSPDHPKVQNRAEEVIQQVTKHFASDHGVLEDSPVGFGGYVWVCVCFWTSSVFCIWGLTWLVSCAIFSVGIKKHKHKVQEKKDGVVKPRLPRLDRTNKKLKPSLAYYVEARGYKMESHTLTTSDGFILEMQRIVSPVDTLETRKGRYPVLLLHGLLQAAAAYASSGEHSLAFFLLESGYDVWLGNNRNGFKPKHTHYSYLDLGLWSWRIREMGTRDLPAMIDHIIAQTGAEKVALVAHSQGTTQTFLALSKDWMPELGDKISGFVALAPAVYGGKLLDRYFLKWARNFDLAGFRFFFGHHGFFSIMMQMRRVLPFEIFSYCGHIMFSYLFEWNDYLWDKRYRDRQFIFSPVYVSAELMHWWVGKGGFADRGCIFEHNDANVPWFNNKLPPVCIVVPGLDDLVNPDKLVDRFRDVESKFENHDVTVVNVPHYSHVDVLWAMDTIETVGKPLKEFIWRTRKDVEGREWAEPSDRIVHVPSVTS